MMIFVGSWCNSLSCLNIVFIGKLMGLIFLCMYSASTITTVGCCFIGLHFQSSQASPKDELLGIAQDGLLRSSSSSSSSIDTLTSATAQCFRNTLQSEYVTCVVNLSVSKSLREEVFSAGQSDVMVGQSWCPSLSLIIQHQNAEGPLILVILCMFVCGLVTCRVHWRYTGLM